MNTIAIQLSRDRQATQRGQKMGWHLAMLLIDAAREIGYSRLTLDSHRKLIKAHTIYHTLGFVVVPPPNDMPEFLWRLIRCYL